MNQYLNQISQIYTFSLTLPKASISNNATTVSEDGKTLTWNLVSGNISTIEFEFEFPSIFHETIKKVHIFSHLPIINIKTKFNKIKSIFISHVRKY